LIAPPLARLDQAGWVLGPEGARDGHAELTIVSPSQGSHPDVAQLLEAAWEAIGAGLRCRRRAGLLKAQRGIQRHRHQLLWRRSDVLRRCSGDGSDWMNIADPGWMTC
jgi:hypothetical protein